MFETISDLCRAYRTKAYYHLDASMIGVRPRSHGAYHWFAWHSGKWIKRAETESGNPLAQKRTIA